MSAQARPVPSFFLLVPGPWQNDAQVLDALSVAGLACRLYDGSPIAPGQVVVEHIPDDDLAPGFAWSRTGPLPAETQARIAACPGAALLELGFRLDQHPDRVAALSRALRDGGGVAVRVEASGAAWAWEPWLARLDSGLPARAYRAAVLPLRGPDGELFTRGMQVFGLPDAQIGGAGHDMDEADAVAWLDALNLFQLTDAPILLSGHTFRPDEDGERRALERWPDTRHAPKDGRHNPYGVWRLLPPGQPGLPVPEQVPVFVPSLVATLTAMEKRKGSPLTRELVEALVQRAVSMPMAPADAVALERSRGYADLEPGLAWAQWEAMRGAGR